MVPVMTNGPLCLNAPEPALITTYLVQCPDETSPTNSFSCTASTPSQASPVEEQPPPSPYQSPSGTDNIESWQVRLLRLLGNLAMAPTRLLASTTNSSQRAQVWLGLLGLAIGAYYYYKSYLVSSRSLVLSQKAYETTIWKDCRDRPNIRNTSVCHRYADVVYDSIAKRSLTPDVVGMLIGTSQPADLRPSPNRASCQWQADEPRLLLSPTQLLCLLHAASWPLYCAAKVVTLCALVYVYAVKMTPIAPAKRLFSDTMAYTALLCVALSFLMGCWHADVHSGTFKSQWQFILKGVLCFHWGFAWYRLLQSRRSPLLLLKGRLVWKNSSLFTLCTDVVLFVLTAIFLAHIISSTISGITRFPQSALLWVHLPLLTLLYAAGKALRVHAYLNDKCRTTFDDEAQEEREAETFRQSPLVESVRDLSLWLCRRECRRQPIEQYA